jgi:hypothetical protein
LRVHGTFQSRVPGQFLKPATEKPPEIALNVFPNLPIWTKLDHAHDR